MEVGWGCPVCLVVLYHLESYLNIDSNECVIGAFGAAITAASLALADAGVDTFDLMASSSAVC